MMPVDRRKQYSGTSQNGITSERYRLHRTRRFFFACLMCSFFNVMIIRKCLASASRSSVYPSLVLFAAYVTRREEKPSECLLSSEMEASQTDPRTDSSLTQDIKLSYEGTITFLRHCYERCNRPQHNWNQVIDSLAKEVDE